MFGTLIGIIYLSSIIGHRSRISRSLFTCGFTIATIISLVQTGNSSEICSASLILLYSLIALNLSSSNCLFFGNDSKNARPNVRSDALHLIDNQTKPLIYLAGAKLLTTFCYFLPFVSIVSQILVQPNVMHADVSNTVRHFFGLFLSRLALGTVTILLARHNVNYLSVIYLMPLATFLAAILLIPLLDHKHLTECTIELCIILPLYVAFSLVVDVIDHRVVFNTDSDPGFVPNVISLTFATFVEHLLDVLFSVVYLNDWIGAKMIITSFAILSLTFLSHRLTTSTTHKQYNKIFSFRTTYVNGSEVF